MKAIDFDGVNAKFAENQPEYETLPAYVGTIPVDDGKGGIIEGFGAVFCMELSPKEIEEVRRTGKIWNVVLTFGKPLQPVSIATERPGFLPSPANQSELPLDEKDCGDCTLNVNNLCPPGCPGIPKMKDCFPISTGIAAK